MGTNTGIGIGIGIPFKNNALGGDKPYFPPELKARMIGVWTNYGKKNTDADRNIIKNKIPNAGGDLEILNAAYKLNSGFGEYKVDFLDWTINSPFINERTSFTFSSFNDTNNDIITVYQRVPAVVQSFKIKAKLRGRVLYRYYVNNGDTISVSYYEVKEGINILPDSADPTSVNGKVGFVLKGLSSIKVELIPNFEDAFVTDGINDIIVSIKTLEEWNIGNKGITIVSMIHQINTNTDNFITTNNIRTDNKVIGRNIVSNIEKTGIYGWYKENIQSDTINVINNILGDKNDYTSHSSPSTNINPINNSKFYVQGYAVENGFNEISSIAHYWTFAVLGKATEDEINLIIGNYNLDRSLKPDILCNIGKQGITNDNHADFNDKLVDYSGNGRDIQMNNLAWKGGSGIAAKPFETIKDYTILSDEARQELTIYNEFSYKVKSNTPNHYWIVQSIIKDNTSYQVTIITDKDCYWTNSTSFTNNEGNKESIRKEYPVKANTPTQVTICGLNEFEYPEGIEPTTAVSYVNLEYAGEVTVTFIPSCKGGLLLDGVNDFGKVTGLPIYKDYTVVADRELFNAIGCVLSNDNSGAFIFETSSASVYSFGEATTSLTIPTDKQIRYQTKYSYNGQNISIGAVKEGTSNMWLGTIRDNDARFRSAAIYSLMSFPYSMSEFLIERQLKKHKLGTLYPDMVEFRPVIKSNVLLDAKPTFVIRGTSVYLNAGDYVPENSQIWVSIKMNNIADRITKFTVNGKTIDISENAYSEVTLRYGFFFVIDKSPQKISITIEQDENYVKFEPVITSNVEYHKLDFYLNNFEKRINIGDYIPKDAYLRANFYLKNNVDELTVFTFNGVNIGYRRSSVDDTAFNINQIYNYDFPQEVNITIDEYIRYEDIVQPYPVLLRFKDENGNEVSWGGKFKVGSNITRIGSIADPESNLLNGLYSISGLSLNGKAVTSSTSIVEKQMVFRTTATWLLDNNEPKCILSPRLLRIPNSSYKILGHIPDISGHGNHGKINNSAYASMSGANGYLLDFKTFTTGNSSLVNIKDDSRIEVININKEKSATFVNLNKSTSISLSSWKIKVTGMKSEDTLGYYYSESTDATLRSKFDIKSDGIYSLPSSIANSNNIGGIAFDVVAGADSAYRIEQIGEYEGAYCLDGVDDFITIPTTVGGKQVLMKTNWLKSPTLLYDQRASGSFAIITTNEDDATNPRIAYQARNLDGKTYIDGIENNYIETYSLKGITHNITVTNPSAGSGVVPVIGANTGKSNSFAKMSLYDFMLFDEISTDDKIKELNEYVGIEAKVELPSYYWDDYGKTNLDEDRDIIQQRGVAVGDYDLTNYNHAYEGMSGYNGYPVVFGANKTWTNESNGYVTSITSNTIHITNVLNAGLALLYSYVKYNGNLQNIKEIPPFKIEIKGLEGRSKFIYKYLATSDATKETNLYLGNGTHELPKSFLPTEALVNDAVLGFSISPIEEGVTNFLSDITIEVLPEYENGLAYDGVSDFTDNKNIPILTDFTFIIKREILGLETNESMLVIKGDKVYNNGIGNAFILEHNSNGVNYVYSYGKLNQIKRDDSKIIYLTPESYNGNPIIKGENGDNLGLVLSRHWRGIIYKTILYSKTISLLEINFLKNLMEKDEIIDLNNPIFIKNE